MVNSPPATHPVAEILATLTMNSSGVIVSCDGTTASPLAGLLETQHSITDIFPELMDAVKTELHQGSNLTQIALIASLPNTEDSCLVQVQLSGKRDAPYQVYVLADNFALSSVKHRQKRLEIITQSLYNSHLDALVTIDGDSIIHEFSPSAESLFGYSRDEAIGKHVADIVIPPKMRTAHNEGMGRFHATRTGPVINTRIEIEAIRRNGEIFPCELTVVPTEEHEGRTYFTASIRDISDRKAHEAALKKAKEIAEASNEAKSRFLAHMSHEIRSPLNAVIGCMDLLLDSGLSGEQMPLAETALEAGHGLLGVIEDVLDFSKIEAGQQKINPSVFNLVELCEQVCDVISIRAGTKEINIACCIDPKIPVELISDASHIRRILTNLMDNAVKFTDAGGVVLHANLGDYHPEHEHLDIQFEIRDTGIGIASEKQTSLFQEFSQVDNSDTSSYGGTGLGLAICRDLAELLGGQITLKSEANIGSTFTVLIPFSTTANQDLGLAPIPNEIMISVLSDNVSFQAVIAEQCKKLSIPCAFINANPQQKMAKNHFAIVDMSSDPLTSNLEDLSATLSLSTQNILLYVRPYAPDIIVSAKAAGFQHILQRPFKPSSLIQRLGVMCGTLNISENYGAFPNNDQETDANSHLRILLAEDNIANQLVAKTMLSRAGHQIEIANNGIEALAALERAEYDLVLMDVRMPKLDGISATKQIRALNTPWSSIPIIAMTANAFDTDIERCLESGMNAFLPKPVNRKELLAMVCNYGNGGLAMAPTSENSDTLNKPSVLNMDIVNRLIDDTSAEAATAITAMFILELEKFSEYIATTDDKANLNQLREMAHSCKSSAGYCGATQFQDLAQKIETACDLQDHKKVSAYLLQLPSILTPTISALRQLSGNV